MLALSVAEFRSILGIDFGRNSLLVYCYIIVFIVSIVAGLMA